MSYSSINTINMSRNNCQLDYLVEVLEECNFDEYSLSGFVFYFSQRISFILPGDKTNIEQDSQEFITNRFNSYLHINKCAELNSQYSTELATSTFVDISRCFTSFAYYLDVELSEDRLNINGEKAETFNPQKNIELSTQDPGEIYKPYDKNELYSKFFYELGKALKQCTSNYREAYAFSALFTTFYSQMDQIGFCEVIQHSFKRPPPFYSVMIDPTNHHLFFDEKGPREVKLIPFQIPLTGFLPNKIIGELVWDQIRLLFFQKGSHETINTELQSYYMIYSEPLLEDYYEERFLPNSSYFLSQKDLISKALDEIKSPNFKMSDEKNSDSKTDLESKFEFIYSILKDNWGFDLLNEGGHCSSQLTFFAYFYYSFILCCIINLEESN